MKYLLNEPVFCEQLARFVKPNLFKDDYVTKKGFGNQQKLSGVAESRIVFWTPPANIESFFKVENRYERLFMSDHTETGWRDGDENDIKNYFPDLTINVYSFLIVAREHLKVTQKRFEKTLWEFKGNCLLVRSIEVDKLSHEEIKVLCKRNHYDLVLGEVDLK